MVINDGLMCSHIFDCLYVQKSTPIKCFHIWNNAHMHVVVIPRENSSYVDEDPLKGRLER